MRHLNNISSMTRFVLNTFYELCYCMSWLQLKTMSIPGIVKPVLPSNWSTPSCPPFFIMETITPACQSTGSVLLRQDMSTKTTQQCSDLQHHWANQKPGFLSSRCTMMHQPKSWLLANVGLLVSMCQATFFASLALIWSPVKFLFVFYS